MKFDFQDLIEEEEESKIEAKYKDDDEFLKRKRYKN